MSSELEIQKKYWDNEVQSFDSIYTHGKSDFSNWLDKKFRWDMFARFKYTIENSKPIAGKTFLDVGCGTGLYSIEFAKNNASEVTGIDISSNMIKICEGRAEKENVKEQCKFYMGDLLTFNPDTKYDVVIGIGLFDYISEPYDVLKKMHDVSRDRAIFSFPRSSTWRAYARKIRLTLRGCPVYFYSESQLEELLKKAGFKRFESEILGQLFCITAFVDE
ncbi:MAG: class I SAM-dependent methyltransferase [Ignavibacteriaceae bacterium]